MHTAMSKRAAVPHEKAADSTTHTLSDNILYKLRKRSTVPKKHVIKVGFLEIIGFAIVLLWS